MIHVFSITVLLNFLISRVNAGEHCIGKDGHHYYCNGFCCAGFGCCSFSSLWYAWTLVALVLAACICGCISCSMRRYHLANQASKYQRRSGYNGRRSNRRGHSRSHRPRESDRLISSQYPGRTYSTCNEPHNQPRGYGHFNNSLPPPYPSSAAPPPYSATPSAPQPPHY